MWMTSTNNASERSTLTSIGVFLKKGLAGSRAVVVNKFRSNFGQTKQFPMIFHRHFDYFMLEILHAEYTCVYILYPDAHCAHILQGVSNFKKRRLIPEQKILSKTQIYCININPFLWSQVAYISTVP